MKQQEVTDETFRDWLFSNAKSLSVARDKDNKLANNINYFHRKFIISNDPEILEKLLLAINIYMGIANPETAPGKVVSEKKCYHFENQILDLRKKRNAGCSLRILARELKITQKDVKLYLTN